MGNELGKITQPPGNYKDIFMNSPLIQFTCDAEGRITSYNKSAEVYWGQAPLPGQEHYYQIAKAYCENGMEIPIEEHPIAITLLQKKPLQHTLFLKKPSGSKLLQMLCFTQPLWNEAQQFYGVFVYFIDVSLYKKQDEQAGILAALVGSSSDAIISKNLDGIIMSWNSGAQKIFGYEESEIVGKSINLLIPDRLIYEEKGIIENIKAGKPIEHFQTVRKSKSGKEIPISLTVSPIINQQGVIIGASKIARDITEKVQKEIRLKQYAERMEILHSIGRLISGKTTIPAILRSVNQATTKILGADFGILV